MMNLLYRIAIAGTILLGITHSALTFVNYDSFSADAFWFFGAGLALVFAGLANSIHYRLRIKFTFLCVLTINILLTAFAVTLATAVPAPTTVSVACCSVLLWVLGVRCWVLGRLGNS